MREGWDVGRDVPSTVDRSPGRCCLSPKKENDAICCMLQWLQKFHSMAGGGEGGGGSPPLSPPGYALTARLILTFEGRRSTGRRGFSVTSAKVRAVKYCDYLDSETVIMQWTHSDILQALAVHSCFSWLAIILLLLSSSFTFFYNFYIGKVKIA